MSRRKTRSRRLLPTVAEFAPRVIKYLSKRVKPLTLELRKMVLKRHVLPAIGYLRINKVGTRALAELATTWIESGATPRTVNMRLGVVARMLSIAVELEVIVGAPRPRYLRVPRRLPRWLSDDEASRLLDAMPDAWRSMVFVALRTGMRIGELRGLRWTDVDFPRGVVVVRRSHPGRTDMPETSPKSGSDRLVALSPEALSVMQQLRTQARDVDSTAKVWPGARSHARSTRACWSAMKRARNAAKLERVSWHTLRHTCASWLVMRGVSLRIVQAVLGHASIRQTEVYAHLSPGFAFHTAMAMLDVPMAPWVPQIKALPVATSTSRR